MLTVGDFKKFLSNLENKDVVAVTYYESPDEPIHYDLRLFSKCDDGLAIEIYDNKENMEMRIKTQTRNHVKSAEPMVENILSLLEHFDEKSMVLVHRFKNDWVTSFYLIPSVLRTNEGEVFIEVFESVEIYKKVFDQRNSKEELIN